MLELAITGNRAFSVCRYEADRGGINYTAETLAHFCEQDATRELFFLLGADMLRDLPHWREPQRICETGPFPWPSAERANRRWISIAYGVSPPRSGSPRCASTRSKCPRSR